MNGFHSIEQAIPKGNSFQRQSITLLPVHGDDAMRELLEESFDLSRDKDSF